MPTEKKKTFAEQYAEKQNQVLSQRYEFVDKYQERLDQMAVRSGQKSEELVKWEKKNREMQRELRHKANMTWDEIKEIKDAAMSGGATVVGGVLDIGLRPYYALTAIEGAAVRHIAPEGSEVQKALKNIGDAYIALTDYTSNPVVGALAALHTAADEFSGEEGRGTLMTMAQRTAGLAAPQDTKGLFRALALGRSGRELATTPNGAKVLAGVADRGRLAAAFEAYNPLLFTAALTEVFSGVGGLKGEKRGYADAARDLGIIEGRRPSEKLQDALGKPALEVWNPFGKNIEFGFSPDGEEWLKIQEDSFFDPTTLGASFAGLEVLGDPMTFVTMGQSGAVRVLGRGLSKPGKLRFGKIITEVEEQVLARAKVARDTAKGRTLLSQNDTLIRQAAEERMYDEGMKNLDYFMPKGEVRFMGKPIGAFGGKGEKIGIGAKIAQGLKVEEGMSAFRNTLVKAQNAAVAGSDYVGLRPMLERAGTFGRRVQDIFQADLSKLPEVMTMRKVAEGTASMKGTRTNQILNSLRQVGKDKTKSKIAIDLMSDPLSNPGGAPLPFDLDTLIAHNDEITELYGKLNQLTTRNITMDEVQIIRWHTRLDGNNLLTKQLDDRLALAEKRRADIIDEINERLARAQQAVDDAVDPFEKKELGQFVTDIEKELLPKNLAKVTALPRTEIFFRNSDRVVKAYTNAFADQYSHIQMQKVKTAINKLVKSKAIPKDLHPDIEALYKLRLAVEQAPDPMSKKLARKTWNDAMDKAKKVIAGRAERVLAKGDRASLMSLLSREDVLHSLEQIRKRHNFPRLYPVTNPLEHVSRRSSLAYAKEAITKIAAGAARLAKDDKFIRRTLERNLVPVGVLENNPHVDLPKVDRLMQNYKAAQVAAGGKRPTINIGDVVRAVDTREEAELVVRNWLLGDDLLGLPRTQGTLSKRLYEVMYAIGDEPGFVPTAKVPRGAKSAEEVIEKRFREEAQHLRNTLEEKGLDMHKILPSANLSGVVGPDGTKMVSFRQLVYEDGAYHLTDTTKGAPLYIPESLARALQRLAKRGAGDPEVGRIIGAWDKFTNFTKIVLTAIGGYPAFQVRNLYSNVAFGLTGAHVNLLDKSGMFLAEKLARNGVDPKLTLTNFAHQAALDHRAMTLAVLDKDITQAGLERALNLSYGGGRKFAREALKDTDAIRKQATKLLDELNTTVLVDDFGHKFTQGDVMRHIHEQGVDIDPRALAEFTGNTERFLSEPTFRREWMNKATRLKRDVSTLFMEKALRSNAYIEQFSRQQLFLANLKRGLGPEEAGRLVNKWLLDYQSLSPFERTVMKRIFPFYTFYRKATPLMAEAVFTRPGSVAVQAKLLSNRDPVLTFGSDEGERIVLQNDGNVAFIGNVDLPINTLNLLGNLAWLPGTPNGEAAKSMRGRGLKEIALLLHPAFHSIIGAAGEYDLFSGKKRSQINYNAVGALMERTPGGQALFENGTIVKDKDYNGKTIYKVDRGKFTFFVQMTGISRILKNADRIMEASGSMSDGEIRGIMQWLTGLKYEEMTGDEQMIDQARAVYKALEDEAVERTERRRFQRSFVPAN